MTWTSTLFCATGEDRFERWLCPQTHSQFVLGSIFGYHFAEAGAKLMEAVRHCSLGQISNALYEVGGQYRRSM
jgi:methylmalonyl-CoA mutase N-terminal domain/subunit